MSKVHEWIVFNGKLILVERPQYWKNKYSLATAIILTNYRRMEQSQKN